MRPSPPWRARLALGLCLGLIAAAAGASEERCEAPFAASDGVRGPAAEALRRGDALALRGDSAAALAAYQESERLARARGDARLAALAAASAIRADLETGRLEGLEERLAGTTAAARSLDDPRDRASVLLHLGRTWERLAEQRPAAAPRAAAALRQAAETADAAGDRRVASFALGFWGRVYERAGRTAESERLTRRAIFSAQAADAPDSLYLWQWQLGRLERAAGRPGTALAAYRQATATLAELRSGGFGGSGGDASAFRREVEPLYVELVDLLLTRAAAAATPEPRQALLAEARNSLEDLKAAELRDYFRDACLEQERKTAPDTIPGAVVIYPIVLPDRVELIVGGTGSLESIRSPVDRASLVAEVRELRHFLERRTTRQYLRASYRLYDWLIRPIEPALTARDAGTLVFVPGGALRTIPFGALRDRESGKFLIEKYPIAVTPGLTLTDPRPIEPGDVRLLAAGITESVQGFPPLVNVTQEIEGVERMFPGETLMNSQFVVKRFEAEVRDRPFGVVHIASHGEFDADPSKSFLLAYDGKLSMDRLAAMIATTRFRQDTPLELLTLSACQTAAGDDRAALGLAGVAVRAGARSALATLWSVNDEAASELVTEFYDQLQEGHNSRARSLQRAQLRLLEEPEFHHPAFWAPFLLISSWL